MMEFVIKFKPENDLILVAILPNRATFEIQKNKHRTQLLLKGLQDCILLSCNSK